jgi:hydrogenase expression/formation protein HypC
MCLAIPGKITSIRNEDDPVFRTGIVSFDGIEKEVNLVMVPQAKTGDYVLVHVGVALNTINTGEAEDLWSLYRSGAGMEDEANKKHKNEIS